MLNIGVDIDGVLSNFTKASRNLCKELFGKPSDSLVQTGWGFDSLGLTSKEETVMWKHIDRIHNWWLYHEPMENTNLLKPLCDTHRVYFITNRKDGTGLPVDKQSAQWLVENFHLFLPAVVLSDMKGPVAQGLKLDYFIDDRPKNVAEVVAAAPLCKTAMLDATYNQDAIHGWRVSSFNDFVREIL